VRAHLAGQGVKTWMDLYDIRPGAYWPDEIDAALQGASLVLGLLSPDAVASRNVKNEWDWAIQNDKQLLLLMTRSCVIPHRYVAINFIDATTDDGLQAALGDLLRVPGLRPSVRELPVPQTRYARSGDVNIAYQMFGEGETDLVLVPGYISHVEHLWKLPEMAAFLRRLGSIARVLLFDKRGSGMSDRTGRISTMEERMDDIRAVMDAARSKRAVIMGISEGAALSILFAATHPQRTEALILYGGQATYVQQPDYPWGEPIDKRKVRFEAAIESLYETWGTAQAAREVIGAWGAPSLQDDEALVTWFAELIRLGASPGAEIARQRMNFEIDVRHVLPTIRVPTLVLNRIGDRDADIGEARYIASKIPEASLEELPGEDHFPMVGDQESLFGAIERFLGGAQPATTPAERETVLATVVQLRSDESESAAIHALASQEIERFRGRIVAAGGDGIVAVFDGPARAIRFAGAVQEAAGRQGISARGGIQTGEMELGDGHAYGPPVDIAGRLAALAHSGQLLATGTVRDLVAGSGLRFDDAPGEQIGAVTDLPRMLVVDAESLG
jgi:pimeloyl-ACP methyl ester carboxylesterase